MANLLDQLFAYLRHKSVDSTSEVTPTNSNQESKTDSTKLPEEIEFEPFMTSFTQAKSNLKLAISESKLSENANSISVAKENLNLAFSKLSGLLSRVTTQFNYLTKNNPPDAARYKTLMDKLRKAVPTKSSISFLNREADKAYKNLTGKDSKNKAQLSSDHQSSNEDKSEFPILRL